MPVKATFGFRAYQTGDRSFSWTFSRWLGGAGDLSNSNDTVCARLANTLLQLLGNNVVLQSVRLSLFTQDPTTGAMLSSRQRNRLLVPSGTGTGAVTSGSIASTLNSTIDVNAGGGAGSTCEIPNGCVQAAYDGGAGGSGAKNTDTHYIAGIPDALIGTGTGGTIFYSNVPGWLGWFQAFVQTLKNDNWSFLGTSRPPTSGVKPILGWSNEAAAPNRLIFTSGFNLFPMGSRVHIRGVRMSVPRTPRPVGTWRVAAPPTQDANGNWACILANSSAFTASNIISLGTVESVSQSLWPYLGTGTPLRACTRKRGGSYGAARGRSKPRVRVLA